MAEFEYPPGATPLEPDEAEGLLLPHITTRSELDRWEQDNILEAETWAFRRRSSDLLNENFILKLHEKMFGVVWEWAGSFRRSEKKLGVDPLFIRPSLLELCRDVETWIEFKTYPADEIAARFHHRLVFIHLFPNGNGRHARLMADLLLVHVLNRPRFTWGGSSITDTDAGECRTSYINALRSADRHDYSPLLSFVRS
jgi:Fic-DOC domain mobile mystery protein B